MYSAFLRSALLALFASSILAQNTTLRVCADPNNLPFSNERGEGFENKLAELIADAMNTKLEYTWWSQRRSFAKKSLDAGACDVVMGVPVGMGDVLTTEPYYRSTYVFVTRKDRNLKIASISDPALSDLRIGIHMVGEDFAPPAHALARLGLTRNISGFSLLGPYGEANPPRKLIDAVENGEVDIGIVWGPFAGYFARGMTAPLEVTPVTPPIFSGIPFVYDISMGVRPGNESLKGDLERMLHAHSAEVEQILASYGVPRVP